MLEKNWLTCLGPDKFPTRRSELMQKKPNKEISIDQSQLVVKDKQLDLTCPTVTELEISNALKRRALASDLVGVCAYDVMAAYSVSLHVRKAKHIQAKCPKPIATGPDLAHNFEPSNSCLPGRTSAPKAATSAKLQSSEKRSRSANRQSNQRKRKEQEQSPKRLQFASSQVFGRKFKRLLKVLSNQSPVRAHAEVPLRHFSTAS